jgi:hypothetical protein
MEASLGRATATKQRCEKLQDEYFILPDVSYSKQYRTGMLLDMSTRGFICRLLGNRTIIGQLSIHRTTRADSPRHGVFRCMRASEKISPGLCGTSLQLPARRSVKRESSVRARARSRRGTMHKHDGARCIMHTCALAFLEHGTHGSVVKSTPHPCRSRLARSSKCAFQS